MLGGGDIHGVFGSSYVLLFGLCIHSPFTIDCFYNGFLQNVPSLLVLVTKLNLIARSVIS